MELKVYHHELRHNEYEEFYLKYEADKVIAEKDKEIARQNTEIKNAVIDLTLRDKKNDELAIALNHHKYKRCLDNAWGCQQRMELFHELVLEEARTIALPNEVALKEYRSKRERAAKWHKRWLKIAEKFKDKEAK